jgi:hypothetical protein
MADHCRDRRFAALAITRFIEDRTGWSIKKFGRTASRSRIGASVRHRGAA